MFIRTPPRTFLEISDHFFLDYQVIVQNIMGPDYNLKEILKHKWVKKKSCFSAFIFGNTHTHTQSFADD